MFSVIFLSFTMIHISYIYVYQYITLYNTTTNFIVYSIDFREPMPENPILHSPPQRGNSHCHDAICCLSLSVNMKTGNKERAMEFAPSAPVKHEGAVYGTGACFTECVMVYDDV